MTMSPGTNTLNWASRASFRSCRFLSLEKSGSRRSTVAQSGRSSSEEGSPIVPLSAASRNATVLNGGTRYALEDLDYADVRGRRHQQRHYRRVELRAVLLREHVGRVRDGLV